MGYLVLLMSSRFFLYNPKSRPRKKLIQEPFSVVSLLFEQLHALLCLKFLKPPLGFELTFQKGRCSGIFATEKSTVTETFVTDNRIP